ncbi:MAG: NADH-quinone oxidoreductase subunit NuoE [Fusobacterium necrophorum]|nr:NADH-quinone oxidoreductase subunit NuoE [Fusobacterium necrophorum]
MICKDNIGFKKLGEAIDEVEDKEMAIIPILHKAQEIFGYLPEEVQQFIAEKMEIPIGRIYGIVTFYNFFSTNPKGKHQISVCTGTACYVRGAQKVLDEIKKELGIDVGQTTEDGLFSLDCLRCIGACGLAPVMMIDSDVHGKLEKEQVAEILSFYRNQEQ